jgi:hypothetical protein
MTGLATYGHQQVQAQYWVDKGRDERAVGEMVPYYRTNLANGGSQEGTGYGIAHRDWFEMCHEWESSTGEALHELTTHAENSGYWLAHSMFPGGGFIVNVGDHSRDRTGKRYDYHLMYADAGGKLYPTNPGYRAAKFIINTLGGLTQVADRHNRWSDLLMKNTAFTAQNPERVLNTAYYNPSTGYIATRTSWASTATLVTMMAGPYTEEHAHQDQGSFMIIKGNNALIDDANMRSMRPNTGVVQHVAAHSGFMFYDSASIEAEDSKWILQLGPNGGTATQVLALADNDAFTYTCVDTLPVYNGNPKVTKSQSEQLFLKLGCIVRCDRGSVNASTVHRVFNLNMGVEPTRVGDLLRFTKTGDTLRCWRIAPAALAWQSEQLRNKWGSTFSSSYRAWCADSSDTDSLLLHVLDVNGDVASVAANNTDSQTGVEQTGVEITFTDGRVAIVRFNNTTTGGTLDYRKTAGGVEIFNEPLPSTPTEPPLLVP